MNKKKIIMKESYYMFKYHKKIMRRYRDAGTGFDAYYSKEILPGKLSIYIDKSNEPIDWLRNFWHSKTRTMYGGFHSGYFQGCFDFMLYLIRSNILQRDDEVLISGYSYGGGCAKILFCIMNNGCYNVKAVSMEGAKTIDKLANKLSISNKLYSVQNGNDLVTKVPWNFVSGGEVVNIGPKRRWWKTGISFRYDKTKRGLYRFITVADHEPDNFDREFKKYIERLEKNS